ncbi:MAG: hypothetical protein NXH75_05980 [Halobacteriovoraceae bacterium]|nr:hypothetical protein [Halobacteriovoraceae bacterium]
MTKFLIILLSPIFIFSASAENIVKIKGKSFIFDRDPNGNYKVGSPQKFYNAEGKLILFVQILKCNSSKCIAKVKRRKKGLTLSAGMSVFSVKPEKAKPKDLFDEPIVAPAEKEKEEEPTYSKRDDDKRKKYLVKAGIGGQNSASAFAEIGFLGKSNWAYGLVLSSRIAARSDLDMSSFSYGGRLDYYWGPIEKKGYLASLNVGMANVTYTALEIDGVGEYSESESIPYATVMAGYKFWLGKAVITLAGGLSYMGYKENLEDPTTQIVFVNPYAAMDLALEASLGFTF